MPSKDPEKRRLANLRYRESHKSKIRDTKRRYELAHKVEIRQYHRQYELDHKSTLQEYRRDYYLRKNYGLTLAQYDKLLASQDGRCVLCNHVQTGKRLSVDHDHITGRIRGLLCITCNTDIGRYEKLAARPRIAEYLKMPLTQ